MLWLPFQILPSALWKVWYLREGTRRWRWHQVPLGEFLLPSHYPAGLVAFVRKTRCLPGTWRGRLPSKHQSWLWGKHWTDHVSHRPNVSCFLCFCSRALCVLAGASGTQTPPWSTVFHHVRYDVSSSSSRPCFSWSLFLSFRYFLNVAIS